MLEPLKALAPVLALLAAGAAGGLAAGAAAAQRVADAFPPRGAFIEIDGVRLHYRETGPRQAAPVLVLHGASANLEEPFLALDGHLDGRRAIYLDRPGLGWSERPAGRWTPEREADLIAGFLDAMDAQRAVVIGHSWGGAIALRLAIDHPESLAGLVLVAPAARAWVGEAAWYNTATRWPLLGTLLTRIVIPTYGRARLEGGARSAFAPEPMPEGYVENAHLPLILRASNWKANAADMAQVNRHLADQEIRYSEIRMPVEILAGPDDTVLLTPRHSGAIAQTLPDAELTLIETAGHNLHHAHAEAVAQAVDSVFSKAGR